MKKSKKNNVVNHDIALPAIVSMETLSYTSDEELNRHLNHLYSEKDKADSAQFDLRPWEVEICYITRELQIRFDRRAAHDRYLRTNPETNFYPSGGAR